LLHDIRIDACDAANAKLPSVPSSRPSQASSASKNSRPSKSKRRDEDVDLDREAEGLSDDGEAVVGMKRKRGVEGGGSKKRRVEEE
jgi:hypothetical protein